MNEDTLEAWLTLLHLDGIGPRMTAEIIDAYGEPATYLAASEADRASHGLPAQVITAPRGLASAREGVAADRRWAEQRECHIITRADPRYPARLAEIPDPPPVLFVRGDPAVLENPQIAVVGTRNPTPGGIEAAEDFAGRLAASGLTVTSGLALGIDTAAHEGALVAEGGISIAVMATGPDRLYPRENQALARSLVTRGAIVTEMPVGTPVNRGLFPRRNRLISGLALGVLVVEAGRRSGALGTAHQAVEQGREVMAIPGSIHNPVAKGCHQLIREGARLVEKADDVIDEIRKLPDGWMMTTPDGPAAGTGEENTADTPADSALDADYRALLDAMGHDPIGFETLAERTSLTPDILSSMLLSLELMGHVAPCNGGHYMRISNRAGG
ncbi:DNA-processing protein DprA [Spiribacter insolitus]|uniref:DNA-processing protein DprA n=1 Tax=Spiribacter insolitus TaxID=3122417 RepID=A0ABV3T9F1_9GAMM